MMCWEITQDGIITTNMGWTALILTLTDMKPHTVSQPHPT